MIRVVLPAHLRTLARVDGEVKVAVDGPVTQSAVLDALEARYPVLRGTIRDHVTRERRAFLRIFACEEDLSHDGPDAKLPDAVATGAEPLLIVGAMAGGADDDAIVLTHVLDAPRETVWKAWTEPERLKGWWGPRGFTSPEYRIDLRPGGRFHACMRSPDALLTLTFDAHEVGKTRLTVHHAVGGAAAAEREMCRQGWAESLDKLAE